MKQIYVHGLGQTSDSWTKTIDILQTTDYSLCPNLPDLVHSKEVTYDNLYAAFSDYCNQYDEPIDLCGNKEKHKNGSFSLLRRRA